MIKFQIAMSQLPALEGQGHVRMRASLSPRWNAVEKTLEEYRLHSPTLELLSL